MDEVHWVTDQGVVGQWAVVGCGLPGPPVNIRMLTDEPDSVTCPRCLERLAETGG